MAQTNNPFRIISILAVFLAALLLLGCNGNGPKTSPTPPTTPVLTPSETVSATPATASSHQQLKQSYAAFYSALEQKILTHDVDSILLAHDELFAKVSQKKISDDDAIKTLGGLTKQLENTAPNSPSHLSSWKGKKIAVDEKHSYFGNWEMRPFFLSGERIWGINDFRKLFSSEKLLLSYEDITIQDNLGNLREMDAPSYTESNGNFMPFPPVSLLVKSRLRMGVIPVIQLHLYDTNSETWFSGAGLKIEKQKQFGVSDVADGKLDDYLKRQVKTFNAIDYPIILLFVNEFNTYSAFFFGKSGKEMYYDVERQSGKEALFNQYGDPSIPDGPERIRDAWKKLRTIMDEQGASSHISLASHAAGGHQNNAFRDANPNAPTPHLQDWNKMKHYWPGENVLDFVGMSAYGKELTLEKDSMSLYGSIYYWNEEIKSSAWSKTPLFYNEFSPLPDTKFQDTQPLNYIPEYITYSLGKIVPDYYPVSFVLFISPVNVRIDTSERISAFKKAVVDNSFYSDSVKLK